MMIWRPPRPRRRAGPQCDGWARYGQTAWSQCQMEAGLDCLKRVVKDGADGNCICAGPDGRPGNTRGHKQTGARKAAQLARAGTADDHSSN